MTSIEAKISSDYVSILIYIPNGSSNGTQNE